MTFGLLEGPEEQILQKSRCQLPPRTENSIKKILEDEGSPPHSTDCYQDPQLMPGGRPTANITQPSYCILYPIVWQGPNFRRSALNGALLLGCLSVTFVLAARWSPMDTCSRVYSPAYSRYRY